MKMSRLCLYSRRLFAGCIVLASMTLGAACTVETPVPRTRVLLIGLDGLEWNLVVDLLRDGRLPNLARQIRTGTFGELETMHPSLSPAIWATVATGVPPAKHGIRGFIKSGPKGPELFTNRDRRTKALWNIATDAGLTSGVVGWWNTFPVEPLRGVMVAQTNTSPGQRSESSGILKGSLHQDMPHQVEPVELAGRLLGLADEVERGLDDALPRIFGDALPRILGDALPPILGDALPRIGDDALPRIGDDALPRIGDAVPADGDPVARMWKESLWSIRADLQYERVALDLLATRGDFDLFLVYFGGTDVLAHRFWRWVYPSEYRDRPNAESVAAYGSIVRDYYEYMDGVVGRLVAAAPPDTVVIVMSDHGMAPANRRKPFVHDAHGRAQRSGSHGRTNAFFSISGPGIRQGLPARPARPLRRGDVRSLGSISDVTPTVLALLGLPVGADMPGKVVASALEPDLLRARPVREVDTHTPAEWFRSRPLPRVEDPREDERLEQLRSLGYIE